MKTRAKEALRGGIERLSQGSSVGMARAMWSLRTPLEFSPLTPTISGVPFGPRLGRGRDPLADVYLPEGEGPHPSVVIVHGGGLAIGSRTMKPVRYLAKRLVPEGLAVMAFDYRLVHQGGGVDEGVEDTTRAIRWWLEHERSLNLDPERLVIVGLSAGACLMLRSGLAVEGAVREFVSIFGLYDLADLSGGPGLMARASFGSAKQRHARSPICRPMVTCPVTIAHGVGDALVPISQARAYAARREAAGLPVRYTEWPDAPHAYLNFPGCDAAEGAIADIKRAAGL